MARKLNYAQRRKRNLDRAGIAIIAACALAFGGMLYGAYKVDEARGITLSESLADHGIGAKRPTFRAVVERSGESDIIDHDQSLADCMATLDAFENDSAVEVSYCEREVK